MHKVSIIVPVHNTEQYLSDCVGSLLAQTHQNIEIILVENASSDGSSDLCDKLAEGDRRIKVIHSDIGDPANARNEGIAASTGDYIGFVDSDDTIEPDMYEQMLKLAVGNGLEIVLCDFVKKYDYRTARYEYVNDGKITIASPMEFLKKNFKNQIPQSACTLLCHRRLFEEVRFPVNRYYEDTATTWRLILAAKSAGHIARPFYHYYRHSGSIVHTPSFRIHYGHVLADMERIDFINSCAGYTDAEKHELAAEPLSLFCKHLKKMVSLAETDNEKQTCIKCRDWVMYLSPDYRLRFKYRLLYKMIRNCWKLFCVSRRGKTL